MKLGGFKLGKKEKAALEEELVEEEVEEGTEEVPLDIIADVEPVKPHAPLQELTLDAETEAEAGDDIAVLDPAASAEEESEAINLVEVQPDPAADAEPPPPAEAKKDDPLDLSASISNIFTDPEDEENPLANLIKSLPEVAAAELIDDLKEINDIIKDWQKK